VNEKEKKQKYCLINAALKMNQVTIRDANLFSAMNEFSKEFADCVIISLMNLFFEYDQLSLIKNVKI
jgi:hypothetical protein